MTDQDYSELRIRLIAHQVLLCAVLATHQNKDQLSSSIAEVIDQMQSQLLSSHLDDKTIATFDQEIQSVLRKAGITLASG